MNAGWWLNAGRLYTVDWSGVSGATKGFRIRVGGLNEGRADSTPKREVEVREHDVSVITDEDILWLEITIDNPKHVQIFQGKEDFSYIEPAIQGIINGQIQNMAEQTEQNF